MNILVLGDKHVYGYGLPARQLSYVGHFVRQVSQSGRAVFVEAYAHSTMPEVLSTLARASLGRYDLIVLQPGPDWLLPQPGATSFGRGDAPSRWKLLTRLLITGGLNKLFGNQPLPQDLSAVLTALRPYRHNVLMLTPFPRQERVSRCVQRWGRAVLLREGNKQLFSVFDTNSLIQARDEYLLPNDDPHLNAVSHELIGRGLFDFYQSAPTIVTVQAIRRN